MARTVTIGDTIQKARILADMRHTTFISDDDAIAFTNIVYPEFYDTLVMAFQNYFVADPATIALTPGTVSYDLPADFYKLITLERLDGLTKYTTIFPYNELEKNSTISSDSQAIPSATVRVRYVPAPTIFTDLSDTFDGVAGWDIMLAYDLAIMFLQAEESDTSSLERKRIQINDRITSNTHNRDLTMPGTITDVSVFTNAWVKDELRYRFYGDKIEFLTVEYTGV